MRALSFAILVLVSFTGPVRADGGDDDAPGHSLHGEAFNEGPRQAAVLMAGMPKIEFPITTKSPEAQKFFTQGIAQQHGFWYFEAERSHRQASALDPDAAMPYWGMALANVNNEKRAKGFLAKAIERKAKASKREQLWITAMENFYKDDKRDKKQRQLDYIRDLESIVHELPDDIEAKAFLAWKIWDARNDAPISSLQAVDSLLDLVFAVNSMHPAHHYRIHLWDDSKPIRALKSDSLCGQTSPGIAHMWHMPGHTFSKLNRYDDAAWQQEASTRVDHAYMMRSLVLPDRIHNYAHNEEWLIRTWNELGRARDGISLAKALIENPRHPELNTLDKASSSASYGRTRLLETLIKWELWEEVITLSSTPFLEPAIQPSHEATRLRSLGIAQYGLAKGLELATTIKALEVLEKKQAAEAAKKPDAKPAKGEEIRKAIVIAQPESKSPTDVKKPEPKKQEKPVAKSIAESLAELRALKLMLDKAKPDLVRAALEKTGDTPKPRLIRYYLSLGDSKKAAELAKNAPQDLDGSIAQTEAYAAADDLEQAKKSFERVRDRSYAMDRDLPVLPRLDKLAAKLGVTGDWRKPVPVRADSGKRPTLESLGPVHWSPSPAPEWSGIGMDSKPISSRDYAGKPTLVIFYVGNNCTHCMEQLRTFEGLAADFKKQGIEIIALSPDSGAEAPRANKWAQTKGGFSFTLVSAPNIETFRAYRAYDDFEKFPMHAVALVDGLQRLRWLDVTYKPFMDAKFILEESRRLLALPEIDGVVAR
jgi:peroxiredoxin